MLVTQTDKGTKSNKSVYTEQRGRPIPGGVGFVRFLIGLASQLQVKQY